MPYLFLLVLFLRDEEEVVKVDLLLDHGLVDEADPDTVFADGLGESLGCKRQFKGDLGLGVVMTSVRGLDGQDNPLGRQFLKRPWLRPLAFAP